MMPTVGSVDDGRRNVMITKTVIRPYKGTQHWEADVFMLVDGKELRRRWRSPMPSRLASERWARDRARAFLADYAAPVSVAAAAPPRTTVPLLREFAARWMDEYVLANRHSAAVPLRTVQTLLGHASIVTTERYLHTRKGQHASAIQALESARRRRTNAPGTREPEA